MELLPDMHGWVVQRCVSGVAIKLFNGELFSCFSSYMMCSSSEDLREMAAWEGKGVVSRQRLIERLQGEYHFLAIVDVIYTCVMVDVFVVLPCEELNSAYISCLMPNTSLVWLGNIPMSPCT